MTKYVRVNSAPEVLSKGCWIVKAPSFKEEIKSCIGKKPKSKTMTVNYLREIIAAIGAKYANETFNALTAVNVSKYRGVPCESDAQIEEIVYRALVENCPEILDGYVDHHIKNRPSGTKLIYFLGGFHQTSSFTRNGIDEIKAKDIDVFLGKKPKKIVGKPAITDAEAAKLNNN